jgi:hypothetical protein
MQYGHFALSCSGRNGDKTMENLVERTKQLLENEARSCSMDFGCVTPEYVYRIWGGKVAMKEIEAALRIYLKEIYEF